MTIVQPRLSDGISEWECSLEDLLKLWRGSRKEGSSCHSGESGILPLGPKPAGTAGPEACRARAEKNGACVYVRNRSRVTLLQISLSEYLKKGQDVAKW